MKSREAYHLGETPDYHPITVEAERTLVAELLEHTPEFQVTQTKFGLATLGPYSRYSNLARSIESEVFDEYFDNDPILMKQEYGPYEDASKFFLVIDREEGRKAGVMRLLHNSDIGLKATQDVQTMGLTTLEEGQILSAFGVASPESTVEIATIAVAPEYRGARTDQLVSASMYRALYQYCLSNGYTDLIAVIDAKPLQNLRDIHLPVKTTNEVASPFEYLNAKENSLIHIPIHDIEGHMKSRDEAAFDFLLGSPGLDPYCTLSFTEK